ncbi:uncharacterized protein LOC105684769 isoform X2 [Athalia rosae]|uniref:uncharacterized protein LOC105684769 isoform X2 n=1 Tax=Athalia rosae TaxID=37344 RepID=UPI0020348C7F|nr:uncharacterized protein LOC105684769 isoform X2 [Athalia rosae]
MTLRWIIMIGTFLSVNTKPYMKKLSFEGCKHDSWRVTDISLMPKGDQIYVVADVGYDKNISNILHQITFTLSGCNEYYKCTSHSEFVANDLDCLGKNLTQLDKEACDVAKTLAEWEMDTGEISRNSIMNKTVVSADRDKVCVHYDTKLIGEDENNEKHSNENITGALNGKERVRFCTRHRTPSLLYSVYPRK